MKRQKTKVWISKLRGEREEKDLIIERKGVWSKR